MGEGCGGIHLHSDIFHMTIADLIGAITYVIVIPFTPVESYNLRELENEFITVFHRYQIDEFHVVISKRQGSSFHPRYI